MTTKVVLWDVLALDENMQMGVPPKLIDGTFNLAHSRSTHYTAFPETSETQLGEGPIELVDGLCEGQFVSLDGQCKEADHPALKVVNKVRRNVATPFRTADATPAIPTPDRGDTVFGRVGVGHLDKSILPAPQKTIDAWSSGEDITESLSDPSTILPPAGMPKHDTGRQHRRCGPDRRTVVYLTVCFVRVK